MFLLEQRTNNMKEINDKIMFIYNNALKCAGQLCLLVCVCVHIQTALLILSMLLLISILLITSVTNC